MMNRLDIINRLHFRIVGPVVLMLSLIGAGFSFFVLRTLNDFQERSVREDITWTSRMTYNIVNRHYYNMVISGGLRDKGLERVSKGKAIGELEELGRQKDFIVIVYSETEDRVRLGSGFPVDLVRRIENRFPESQMGQITWDGRKYYAFHFDFDPWRWHIVHLKDASQYAGLLTNIRLANVATGLILLFAAVLLYLLLRWNINRPISRIIQALENGDSPSYHGIREFEYLSESIGRMRGSLEERERFLARIFDSIQDGISIVDTDMRIVRVNPAMERWFRHEMPLVGKKCHLVYHGLGRKCKDCPSRHTLDGGEVRVRSVPRKGPTGESTGWLEIFSFPLVDPETGKVDGVIEYIRDVTDRRWAEDALKESEERFRTAFRTSPDSININRLEDGVYIDINEGFTVISGYSRKEVIGKSSLDLDIWANSEDREKLVEGLRKNGKVENLEALFRMKDGQLVKGLMSAKTLNLNGVPHILSVTRDIGELKVAEDRLRASVEEKELLLKEIHHRVKNNLQVISGLMNLQAHHVSDEDARNVYRESQNRVITMALIHEELYQASDLAHVDLGAYIQNLSASLFDSYGVSRDRINLVLETEQIEMVVDTAIPCGLIINELISNSLKHAFPDGRKGEIRIAFRVLQGKKYELDVSDNGVGLPEGFDVLKTKSMGLQLVVLLMDQMKGTLEVSGVGGAKFSMKFSEYVEAGTALY